MRVESDSDIVASGLVARLVAFAGQQDGGEAVLPWATRLSPADQSRLRSDLSVVLAEPESTSEPLDWREIGDILQEWAGIAGWQDLLIRGADPSPDGAFSLDLRAQDAEVLAQASPAVQRAMDCLVREFLPYYPTAAHPLPRGRLKKLRERDTWQLQLPDGYRLRYVVDKLDRTVHVVYLGPHPDRDARGREHGIRLKVRQRQRGDA
jgi:hypothetical protein